MIRCQFNTQKRWVSMPALLERLFTKKKLLLSGFYVIIFSENLKNRQNKRNICGYMPTYLKVLKNPRTERAKPIKIKTKSKT